MPIEASAGVYRAKLHRVNVTALTGATISCRMTHSQQQHAFRITQRLASLLTVHRMALWGTALLVLSWGVYIHTISVPGYIDRAGRFKGSDFTYFYVSGSLALAGRMTALYDSEAHLAEGRRRIYPELALYATNPNYGPQTALAFVPFAMLPFAAALTIFLCLLALAYAMSVWVIWRECPALRGHGILVAVLAAAAPLFFTTLRYAQLSAFTLLICGLALLAFRRHRRFTAGLVVGLLAFKPQLGILAGIALLAGKEWRVAAGAATSAGAQLIIALAVAGPAVMSDYFGVLWRLVLNPQLVQPYPSEVHSLRGFLQLLGLPPSVVTAVSMAGFLLLVIMAVRTWAAAAPVAFRWALILLLTALASPHFLSYDLILLTVTLLVFADWSARAPDHPARPIVSVLLPAVYFSPFSSNIARLVPVQLSVIAMGALAWWAYRVARSTGVMEGREA